MKLYAVAPSEKMAYPRLEDESAASSSIYFSVRRCCFQERLASRWIVPIKRFWKERKTDQVPTIVKDVVLLVPQGHAATLTGGNLVDLELLPELIDGQSWVLLNTLRKCARPDDASSIASYHPIADRTQLGHFRWLNIIDPAAIEMDIFTIRDVLSPIFVTERFVDRVKSLGLMGVEFRHVGHVVTDASQVVPLPSTEPKPSGSAKRIKKTPKPAQLLELRKSDLAALQTLGVLLRTELGLSGAEEVTLILQHLTQHIKALRPKFIDLQVKQQLPDVLAQLSAVYGDLLVRECAWSYMDISPSRGYRHYGVVSTDRSHALMLAPFMRRQLENSQLDVELSLQFNMIKAGQLPPGGTAEAPVVMS